MKNIAIVSLGSGGTMGHMTLTTTIGSFLAKSKGMRVFIFSENSYEKFSNIYNNDIIYIKIPKQKHTFSIGGSIKYNFNDFLIKEIIKNKIDSLIFSTFFDTDLLEYAKLRNISRFLISYPLRDTHRIAFLYRRYFKYFDKIFTLEDIVKTRKIYPNELLVSFPLKITSKKVKKDKIKKILITAGGGGRPSTDIFFKKIKFIIKKLLLDFPELQFTIILGFNKQKFQKLDNTNVIYWSNNITKTLKEHDLVISEAGYFTMLDLISLEKEALIIPGERRIDNQESRALVFESMGLGACVFPVEDNYELLKSLKQIIAQEKKPTNKGAFLRAKKHLMSKPLFTKKILEELRRK